MASDGNILDQSSICLEHLDAVVGVISHQDVVIRINKKVLGIRKLPTTNMTNKITLRIKDGNATVAVFTNNISIRQQANAMRVGKLTISISI